MATVAATTFARINDNVADGILGRAADTVEKAYGTITLETTQEAIKLIPIPISS